MKTKLVLAVLTAGFLAAGPLPASEAVREVVATTKLRPPTPVLLQPLTEPPPLAMPLEAAFPSPQFALPPRLPALKPPLRTGKALFDANLVVMVGLNIADYVSTREALKYPGLAEANPLMKPFIKNPAAFAAAKLGTTALSYWSMKVVFKRNKTVAWVMTTASNVLLSYVVASNIRAVRGARAR